MKWWSFLICFALFIGGLFCGWAYYNDVKATSYESGSISIDNVFYQDSFSFRSSSVYFYELTEKPDEDVKEDVGAEETTSDVESTEEVKTYYYKVDLLPVVGFNAEVNDYDVYVNGYKIYNPTFKPGSVTFDFGVEFYNTDGESFMETCMTGRINFFVEKTVMQLEVQGELQRDYLQNYVALNGLNITVCESLV